MLGRGNSGLSLTASFVSVTSRPVCIGWSPVMVFEAFITSDREVFLVVTLWIVVLGFLGTFNSSSNPALASFPQSFTGLLDLFSVRKSDGNIR